MHWTWDSSVCCLCFLSISNFCTHTKIWISMRKAHLIFWNGYKCFVFVATLFCSTMMARPPPLRTCTNTNCLCNEINELFTQYVATLLNRLIILIEFNLMHDYSEYARCVYIFISHLYFTWIDIIRLHFTVIINIITTHAPALGRKHTNHLPLDIENVNA